MPIKFPIEAKNDFLKVDRPINPLPKKPCYKLMKDVNEKFGGGNGDDSESNLKKSIYLYSAFSNYDELTNCAVAVGAIVVGF